MTNVNFESLKLKGGCGLKKLGSIIAANNFMDFNLLFFNFHYDALFPIYKRILPKIYLLPTPAKPLPTRQDIKFVHNLSILTKLLKESLTTLLLHSTPNSYRTNSQYELSTYLTILLDWYVYQDVFINKD